MTSPAYALDPATHNYCLNLAPLGLGLTLNQAATTQNTLTAQALMAAECLQRMAAVESLSKLAVFGAGSHQFPFGTANFLNPGSPGTTNLLQQQQNQNANGLNSLSVGGQNVVGGPYTVDFSSIALPTMAINNNNNHNSGSNADPVSQHNA